MNRHSLLEPIRNRKLLGNKILNKLKPSFDLVSRECSRDTFLSFDDVAHWFLNTSDLRFRPTCVRSVAS
jgi:hypothetical protein